MNDFSKHLLTTKKKFIYVGMNDRPRPIKRNKALSKWFREQVNDFEFVMEDENNIYFSDACTRFSNTYMED